MKKGGIEGLVIFAVILFIIIKVIVPKFTNDVGSAATTIQSLSELETAIKDIRNYNMKYGQLTQISLMTSVQGFENSSQRLEKNKSYLYGVRQPKGEVNWCATFEIKDKGGDEYIMINSTGDNSPICKEFTSNPKFSQLRETKLNY